MEYRIRGEKRKEEYLEFWLEYDGSLMTLVCSDGVSKRNILSITSDGELHRYNLNPIGNIKPGFYGKITLDEP